ncbi:hypothetical protein [Pelomonas sp. Root1237]|uniref:hypothetical protein n=1 Tax=Pelomonas sp. Root1237 TaxID=1736434 RepID=UPI000701787C|nr:hypothetical protein [Pelomonas sp. Root1237]KQV87052.1 hypothetical protein ASC91_20730 [Pelomonas sp. Root1237]
MNTDESINALARQARAHWEAGRLDAAEACFVRAIAAAGGQAGVADLHGQLAAVMDGAGRLADAVAQSELALAAELALGQGDSQPSVKVARYFLADRLLRLAETGRALKVLAPSLAALPDDWLLNTAQAEALLAVGRADEAKAAARRALANAGSDAKRAQLAERLQAVLRD